MNPSGAAVTPLLRFPAYSELNQFNGYRVEHISMKKKILVFLFAALLAASNMIPAANAFDIIYDLPPISAKLSEGNKTVTVTFETAPSPGEYIMVYSEWDAFKINEPMTIHTITDRVLVQVVRLDEPAQANVFVSYAPLHTSEGRQIESKVIGSTGYTTSNQGNAVTYLWRPAGKPSAGSSAFSDVPASADYAQAVAWAVQQGITAGTSKTTFSPNVTCTRGQIVTFLYRNMV